MQPLISIIIPTYNRAHIIGETLDSIIAQTYANWECIVIDDGSTDITPELMQKYMDNDSRFQYYHRPNNKPKGPNSCRNYGFMKSKGEIINFFDSDDLYRDEIFEKVLMSYKKKTDAVIVKTKLIDFKTREFIRENKIFSKNLIVDYFIGKITFFIGGPFWKKEFLEKQDYLFDEEIGNGDDWDFNLRMLYSKPTIVFNNEVLIQYRKHKESLSKELVKLNRTEISSEIKVRNKHLSLLKGINKTDKETIKKFILHGSVRYLKTALYQDSSHKYFFAKTLIIQEIKFGYFYSLMRTVIGFVLFVLFKKGYVFLKD